MAEKNEHAFPAQHSINGMQQCGMTLRDYFAAKALSACIQFCERERWGCAAKRAYEMADAMLEARRND